MNRRVVSTVSILLSLAPGCARNEPSGDAAKAPPNAAPNASAVEQTVSPALIDFACEISILRPPGDLKVGGPGAIARVKVTNRSQVAWPALLKTRSVIHSVNLAYHWILDRESIMEGQRTFLTSDLASGQSTEIEMSIAAPKQSGSLTLKIEPVQEAVRWFSEHGGCKAEAIVRVSP